MPVAIAIPRITKGRKMATMPMMAAGSLSGLAPFLRRREKEERKREREKKEKKEEVSDRSRDFSFRRCQRKEETGRKLK
jgi:ribosomal protein L12E/L44/L45/RPP1/RPP2